MTSEEHRARASCRLFILTLLGTVVLAFLLVSGLFHRQFVVTHRQLPSGARAHRHWKAQPISRLRDRFLRSEAEGPRPHGRGLQGPL